MNSLLQQAYQPKDSTYFQVERSEMLPYIPQPVHTVLDVGCGEGGFGYLLKTRHDAEIWGVELNPSAAAKAAQRLDRVICDDFSTADLPQHYFDCIIFNDVLEHLVDPFSAIENCQRLLKTNGAIVASIPNVRYFEAMWNLLVNQDWQYTDYGILDKTHLRFFTQKSVIATFQSAGYSIETIEGINPIEQMHPEYSRRFKWINRLCFNQIADMRYLQFALVARPHTT
jgi:2-polyprenyl-3-methyl-5-hydroxy-6-metoxy-1,4-benzoquinol methylase